MKKILIILFAFALSACGKDKNCENGHLSIVNLTGDTVFYSWGSSWYSDTLLPFATVIRDVGKIENTLTSQSSYTEFFNSDHGDYAIDVTSCNQKFELD